MPAADLAALIASLPPLRFVPAAEAPPASLYLIGPTLDHDWRIALRDDDGAWALDTGELIDAPLYCAALPVLSPSQKDIEILACRIADKIIAGKFGTAAKLIDELADAVRAVRDSPLGRLAG